MLENQNMELLLLKDLGMIFPKETSRQKSRYVIYKCFCGNEFRTNISSVKIGLTKSCGCYHKKRTSELSKTHGMSHNSIYKAWKNIINRTTSKDKKIANCYMDRGITVCNEWKNDFKAFYDWAINNGYINGLSIDRINNDGNYEPSNCRLVNQTIQSRNTRILYAHNTSGYRGVSFNKRDKKFRAYININNKQLSLGYFKTAKEAAKARDEYIVKNNLEHTIN